MRVTKKDTTWAEVFAEAMRPTIIRRSDGQRRGMLPTADQQANRMKAGRF